MKAVRLRTEYLKNPIGIDIVNPRLSWNCEGGKTQSAYEIVAVDDEKKVLWNTGKVKTSQMVHILWDGIKLESRVRVICKVRLWDENDIPGEWSEKAYFELGLLERTDWKAKWKVTSGKNKLCNKTNLCLNPSSEISSSCIFG